MEAPGSTAIASGGQGSSATPGRAGAATTGRTTIARSAIVIRQSADLPPTNSITALPQPIRIFAIIHPSSGILLTAIDHHRSYAEADQAPKPYALHRSLQRDVERGIDHERTRVTADKQEQTGPLGLAA